MREVKVPCIYRHFKHEPYGIDPNNYKYVTMAVSFPIDEDEFYKKTNKTPPCLSQEIYHTELKLNIDTNKIGDVWYHNKKLESTPLVIYRAIYDGKVYGRPISMFLSKVDKNKYPNSTQEYRFEEDGDFCNSYSSFDNWYDDVHCYIEKEQQLKNPLLVYILIRKWMECTGLDFIDQYNAICDPKDVLCWMYDNLLISEELCDVVEDELESLICCDLNDLFGTSNDLLIKSKNNILPDFITRMKKYHILAKYISEHEEIRKYMIFELCTVFDNNYGERHSSFVKSYNTEDDLHTLYSVVLMDDLKDNNIRKSDVVRNNYDSADSDIGSYMDEYKLLEKFYIEEINNFILNE